jgi:hypothetical protein
MYYYDTPNYSIALNAKVASSSMARAIISQFQQKEDWLIRTAAFPPGVTAEDRQWHWMAKGRQTPSKPVVLLVRDPVDRFITACQQTFIRQRDVDSAIASLVSDTPLVRTKPDDVTPEQWAERQARLAERMAKRQAMRRRPPRDRTRLRQDVHFFHQHKYAVGPTTCFRFPRDIAAAAAFIGIQVPMPEANRARRPKPRLTPSQEAAVLAYYATDKALFDAITQAGYVYIPTA